MGEPIECEHSTLDSPDVFQRTTTGQARFDWCTNTPSFSRAGGEGDEGQEHWMLGPNGIEHWTGTADAPRPLPSVRTPDLRSPCPT